MRLRKWQQLFARPALSLSQPIVAENRSGATGMIAHQAIARSAPDGYTLGVPGTSPPPPGLPFDPVWRENRLHEG